MKKFIIAVCCIVVCVLLFDYLYYYQGVYIDFFPNKKPITFVCTKGEKIYDVEAIIYCLRESHKGIIIGKNGEMLKRIGTYARQDLEGMLQTKINLKIWVKVNNNWQDNNSIVKRFENK